MDDPFTTGLAPLAVPVDLPDHDAHGGWPQYAERDGPDLTPADLVEDWLR